MGVVKPGRDRRRARAAATRLRIVEAAGRLLMERGYTGTTIEAIATEADVAVETVYARFRNKRSILDAFLDAAIVGDTAPVPLLERDEVSRIRDAVDQRQQLRLLARLVTGVLTRTAAVQAVLRSAAAVDPEIQDLLAEDDQRRKITHRGFMEMVVARGPLRPELSINEATETFSALVNPDTFAYLMRRRHWTPARYESWLARNLDHLLLSPVGR
ncbi:MAG: helix-turn-helix transcriptional regulator [Chloroflexota bacterium]|nr:helix-turn-helix transcriptional regulator [Chloroflexota bacterium]